MKKKFISMSGLVIILLASFFGCSKDLDLSNIETNKDSLVVKDSTIINKKDSLNKDTPPVDTVVKTEVGSIPKANFYVSTKGNDSNPGTIDKPFKSLQKAINIVKPGQLIYVRGGEYSANPSNSYYNVQIKNKNGQKDNYIKIWAYPGEKPVFNGSNIPGTKGNYVIHVVGCSYIHLKGLEIKNAPQRASGYLSAGIMIESSSTSPSNNNIFEQLNIHDNAGPGFRIQGNSSNNLVDKCDSYSNYDPLSSLPGGNADGFQIAYIPQGLINTITGCRSWNNSDDGYDFWQNEGLQIIKDSWAFHNGFKPNTNNASGDGCGIKLGKTVTSYGSTVKRIVVRNLCVGNRRISLNQNSANCSAQVYNNTFTSESWGAISLPLTNLNYDLKNNIIIGSNKPTLGLGNNIVNNNSWQLSVAASSSDFITTSISELSFPRNADGSMPNINSYKLKENNRFIDAGSAKINNLTSYLGVAPDLGAFEKK